MFTGIVEEVGGIGERVLQGAAVRFSVHAPAIAQALKVGDSVACDGVCLTAETVSPHGFTATAVPETLSRTTLQKARVGDRLEAEDLLQRLAELLADAREKRVSAIASIWKRPSRPAAPWAAISCKGMSTARPR